MQIAVKSRFKLLFNARRDLCDAIEEMCLWIPRRLIQVPCLQMYCWTQEVTLLLEGDTQNVMLIVYKWLKNKSKYIAARVFSHQWLDGEIRQNIKAAHVRQSEIKGRSFLVDDVTQSI